VLEYNTLKDISMEVVHDPTNKQFYISLSADKPDIKAVLEYSLDDTVYDLYHTEVPVELRGRGIAKHLAKAALDHIVKEKAVAILSCTYLQKYHAENPNQDHSSVVRM